MIAIKYRFTGATICEFDVKTIKEAVAYAVEQKINLSGSDLSGIDLSGSDLSGSNLSGSNLSYSNLRGSDLSGSSLRGSNIEGEKITINPLSISGLRYWCLITDGFMRLGCKRFSHSEWSAFSNEHIEEMDTHALEFWSQWKEPLLSMCATHANKKIEEV